MLFLPQEHFGLEKLILKQDTGQERHGNVASLTDFLGPLYTRDIHQIWYSAWLSYAKAFALNFTNIWCLWKKKSSGGMAKWSGDELQPVAENYIKSFHFHYKKALEFLFEFSFCPTYILIVNGEIPILTNVYNLILTVRWITFII